MTAPASAAAALAVPAGASMVPADPVLAVAFWVGIVALALTLLLGVQIVRLRIALRRRQARAARALARWRPILSSAIAGDLPPDLPPLARGERLHFIQLWVHLQSSLRGDAAAALNDIARRVGLEHDAQAMLGRRARAERMMATLVLGHLRERSAWPQLQRMAGNSLDPTLALTALWALVRIDPDAAAAYLTPLFIENDDWAMSHVAGVLKEASVSVESVLVEMLPGLPRERLGRALRVADALRVTVPDELLVGALDDASVAVVTAALRLVNLPGSRERVRALLAHEDWQVRVQAAKALGRIGDRGDTDRLVALLGDREWWVRYRAAEALVELPWLGRAELDALRGSLTDRYAADMLAQALAEERKSS